MREREEQRAQAGKEELVECVAEAMREDGAANPMPGLHLQRNSSPEVSVHGLYGPALCMIAQGSKEVLVGDHRCRYDPAHYLLITVELPVVSWVLEASREQPYLSLHLELDMALVRSVAADFETSSSQEPVPVKALNTGPLDTDLLDAVVRLVRLLNAPAEAILAPLITQEIIYRLLLGKRGSQLRGMADQGGDSHYIARAAEHLRKNLAQSLRVEELARDFGMSVSSFHFHFKTAIGLSPLQFQKRMRLQEARRLMLYEALDAAGAGYQVGYDDAAHFSREYKSLFGIPPKKDVERLREAARKTSG